MREACQEAEDSAWYRSFNSLFEMRNEKDLSRGVFIDLPLVSILCLRCEELTTTFKEFVKGYGFNSLFEMQGSRAGQKAFSFSRCFNSLFEMRLILNYIRHQSTVQGFNSLFEMQISMCFIRLCRKVKDVSILCLRCTYRP